jgi:hypothetical protein
LKRLCYSFKATNICTDRGVASRINGIPVNKNQAINPMKSQHHDRRQDIAGSTLSPASGWSGKELKDRGVFAGLHSMKPTA